MATTASVAAGRKAIQAKVHIAKKLLGLDEETYRDVLERVTRQRSTQHLNLHELERVLAEMRRLGWTGETKRKAPSKQAHVRKIWALWRQIEQLGGIEGEPRAALRSWLSRQVGVEEPEWVDGDAGRRVIEQLKAWVARLEDEAPGAA